jgi:hypothetical protein
MGHSAWWRGVEGPRGSLSHSCCSELFNHRSPHLADPPRSFPGAENRNCEHLAMSGGYIYILVSHKGMVYIGVTSNLYRRLTQQKEDRLTRASVVEKLGPSTPRHQAMCHDHPSVKRSAQDDDFVVTLEIQKANIFSDFDVSQIKLVSAYGPSAWVAGETEGIREG